jgi:quinol-cytochrome oxidoreductase complex cytochrome b subunit
MNIEIYNRKDSTMQRFFALVIVLIPIAAAVYGIKLIRDMIFGILQPPIPSLLLQFVIGLACLAGGLYLIGSFIFHRDKKRNKIQKKLTDRK